MLSLRKLQKAAGSLALVEQPVPEPGPGEALLRVAACGVCGSDLHAYNQDPGYEFVTPPVTLGHEYAGTVVAVGPGVAGWAPGQRACAIAIQGCGTCLACRRGQKHLCESRRVQGLHYDGAMAEFVRVEARYLIPLPEGIDLASGALIEPLSVAAHCVSDRTEIVPGDLVVVTGPGIIGLLSALVARLRGGRVVVAGAPADRDARLPVAEQLGFDTVVAGERPLAELLGRKADVLIEASGSAAALAGTLGAVRRGGQVTVVALYAQAVTWFMTTAVRDEITIRGSYASSYPSYLQAMELMRSGQVPVGALVRHYDLRDGPTAFADALSRKVVKPLLIP